MQIYYTSTAIGPNRKPNSEIALDEKYVSNEVARKNASIFKHTRELRAVIVFARDSYNLFLYCW